MPFSETRLQLVEFPLNEVDGSDQFLFIQLLLRRCGVFRFSAVALFGAVPLRGWRKRLSHLLPNLAHFDGADKVGFLRLRHHTMKALLGHDVFTMMRHVPMCRQGGQGKRIPTSSVE